MYRNWSISLRLTANVDEKGGQFLFSILKDEILNDVNIAQSSHANVVVLITSNVLGSGDDALGGILMKSFMYTLPRWKETFQGPDIHEQRGFAAYGRIRRFWNTSNLWKKGTLKCFPVGHVWIFII